ncbi:hypothetical protein D3C84_881680 [compost metagenome]
MIASARQCFGGKRQWLTVERHHSTALPRLHLEGQCRDGERLRGLWCDLVGVAQAEEGLAIELLIEVLRLTAGRGHYSTGQLQLGQNRRGGKPGVHQ